MTGYMEKFTDEELNQLPAVAWRSETNLMTHHDTLQVLKEATEACLLGEGVAFHMSTPWEGLGVWDTEVVLTIDMGKGVRLMADPIPFNRRGNGMGLSAPPCRSSAHRGSPRANQRSFA